MINFGRWFAGAYRRAGLAVGLHKPVWTRLSCINAGGDRFCRLGADGLAGDERSGRRWSLAALCPLGLALLVGFAIPDGLSTAKQPQFLVDIVSEVSQPSRYVLTNNVGMSAAAWELKRSDIIMFDKQVS